MTGIVKSVGQSIDIRLNVLLLYVILYGLGVEYPGEGVDNPVYGSRGQLNLQTDGDQQAASNA